MTTIPEERAPRSRRSRWITAAIVLACAPLVVAAGCAIAAIAGVKDNQGIIYAFTLPFGAAVVAWPLAASCLMIGAILDINRGGSRRRSAVVTSAIAIVVGLVVLSVLRMLGFV